MREKCFDNRPTSREELLLIRAGHHLWRSMKRKDYPESVALAALGTVWMAKRELRVLLREEWLESLENRQKGLRAWKAKNGR